jgi:hypothetical protein
MTRKEFGFRARSGPNEFGTRKKEPKVQPEIEGGAIVLNEADLADLNPRQRKWLVYYLGAANMHAGRAAEMAGYKWPHNLGSRTKLNPKIATVIDRILAEDMARVLRERAERF